MSANKINMKGVLVILVLLQAAFGRSADTHDQHDHEMDDIEFTDCGSEKIVIDHIVIQGCQIFPCRLRRGQSYNIIITPDYVDPSIDRFDIDVKTFVRGALFPVAADYMKPCGLPCPVNERAVSPEIPIRAELSPTLLRGPAPLIINATYMFGLERKSQFCVEFPINIF